MAKQFLLGIKKVIRLMPIIIGQLLQEIAKAFIIKKELRLSP